MPKFEVLTTKFTRIITAEKMLESADTVILVDEHNNHIAAIPKIACICVSRMDSLSED